MKTGLKKLDEIIKIKGGDLILLGGTASVGKTNFAWNIDTIYDHLSFIFLFYTV